METKLSLLDNKVFELLARLGAPPKLVSATIKLSCSDVTTIEWQCIAENGTLETFLQQLGDVHREEVEKSK